MTPETATRPPRTASDVPQDTRGREGWTDSPGSPRDVGVHLTVSTAASGCSEVTPERLCQWRVTQILLQRARQDACLPDKGRAA